MVGYLARAARQSLEEEILSAWGKFCRVAGHAEPEASRDPATNEGLRTALGSWIAPAQARCGDLPFEADAE